MDEVRSTHRARRRARLIKLGGVTAGVAAAALALSACSSSSNSNSSAGGGGTSSGASGGGGGKKVGVSLILKTLSNPYFVSMEKDAKTAASQNNVSLTVAAGKTDGDTQTQIAAIDNAISRGDKGILITINGNAVNTEICKARQAGLYVIALDTAPTPPSIVDITYATDNEQAGKLIGQYGAAKLNGQKATIAMLDLFNTQVVSVDIQRDHGFLEGMGIDPGSKTENGKEAKTGHYTAGKGGDYEIACHQPTQGDIPHGKTAMENCLSANSNINVVYTINEPAADGAYQALAGRRQGEQRHGLDHRRQLQVRQELRRLEVRRGLCAVSRQDGQLGRRVDRETGQWWRQAHHLQRAELLQHRHQPGREGCDVRCHQPDPGRGSQGLLGEQLT